MSNLLHAHITPNFSFVISCEAKRLSFIYYEYIFKKTVKISVIGKNYVKNTFIYKKQEQNKSN